MLSYTRVYAQHFREIISIIVKYKINDKQNYMSNYELNLIEKIKS